MAVKNKFPLAIVLVELPKGLNLSGCHGLCKTSFVYAGLNHDDQRLHAGTRSDRGRLDALLLAIRDRSLCTCSGGILQTSRAC